MSNPYLDRGVEMPYQISQNRYKEQVLGSRYENYNQNRPEALDGYNQLRKSFPYLMSEHNYNRPPIPESNRAYHNWPIGAHPLEVAAERRRPSQYDQPRYEPTGATERRSHHQNFYESPRQPYDSQRREPYDSQRRDPYESPRREQYESPRRNPPQDRQPPPQQYYGGSPRNDYESRTYRSGRPDMGVEKESHVPLDPNNMHKSPENVQYVCKYPQEPLRRAKHDYEQPPDIGFGVKFDPYKDATDKPVMHNSFFGASDDDGISHPGWLLLLRFNKDGEDQVRKALTFASQISKDGGKVLGIARPYGIRVQEGGEGWVTYGRIIHYQGGYKEVQQTPVKEETNYCVLAIYYPSLRKAQEWFDRDGWFKQKDFPHPYTIDCIALPLSSAIDYRHCNTLVMSEYPKITHADAFRDQFSVPTEMLMRSKYKASPYIVKAFHTPTTDSSRRVARHLRGYWINRNSIVTVSAFDSMSEVNRYFMDGEYRKAKNAQDHVSSPTTVIFDLEPANQY